MITKEENQACKEGLAEIRQFYSKKSSYQRLGYYPIFADKLFNTHYPPRNGFSKQLVLKLIDELLNCGEDGLAIKEAFHD